jgi:hypothetical protein
MLTVDLAINRDPMVNLSFLEESTMKRGNTGCLSEQMAIIYLLKQGYDVFENVSAHGKYDLIAYDSDNDKLIPLDVTTGRWYICLDGSKRLNFPSKPSDINVLVVVQDTGEVYVRSADGNGFDDNQDIPRVP